MEMNLAHTVTSSKPFDEVVAALEDNTVKNMFRVLHTHDVQATLEEKGFERKPLKIIEVCNAGFAHKALNKAIDVAMFMPCKFVVAEVDGKTRVTLVRPSMISQMMPEVGLDELAEEVEGTLKKVLEASI